MDVLILFPLVRDAALFDGFVLLACITLARSVNEGSVYDGSFFGNEMGFLKLSVKEVEELLDNPGLGQSIPEQPDCFGIRHLVSNAQAEKPHESQAVIYLVLRLVVTEIIQPLEEQNFEHEDAVKGRSAAWAFGLSPGFFQSRFNDGAKHLPVNNAVDALQSVAHLAEPSQTVIYVKDSKLHKSVPPRIFIAQLY